MIPGTSISSGPNSTPNVQSVDLKTLLPSDKPVQVKVLDSQKAPDGSGNQRLTLQVGKHTVQVDSKQSIPAGTTLEATRKSDGSVELRQPARPSSSANRDTAISARPVAQLPDKVELKPANPANSPAITRPTTGTVVDSRPLPTGNTTTPAPQNTASNATSPATEHSQTGKPAQPQPVAQPTQPAPVRSTTAKTLMQLATQLGQPQTSTGPLPSATPQAAATQTLLQTVASATQSPAPQAPTPVPAPTQPLNTPASAQPASTTAPSPQPQTQVPAGQTTTPAATPSPHTATASTPVATATATTTAITQTPNTASSPAPQSTVASQPAQTATPAQPTQTTAPPASTTQTSTPPTPQTAAQPTNNPTPAAVTQPGQQATATAAASPATSAPQPAPAPQAQAGAPAPANPATAQAPTATPQPSPGTPATPPSAAATTASTTPQPATATQGQAQGQMQAASPAPAQTAATTTGTGPATSTPANSTTPPPLQTPAPAQSASQPSQVSAQATNGATNTAATAVSPTPQTPPSTASSTAITGNNQPTALSQPTSQPQVSPQRAAVEQPHQVTVKLSDGASHAFNSPRAISAGTRLLITPQPGGSMQAQALPPAANSPLSPAEQIKISDRLRQTLPQQMPTGDAFSTLQQMISPGAQLTAKPQVNNAVRSLLNLFGVSPGASDSADQIRQNVELGGRMTEGRMLLGKTSQRDMKRALNQLRQLSEQLPEAARGQLDQLLQKLQARQTSQQLMALQQWKETPDGGMERVVRTDIPVRQGEEFDNVELTITEERSAEDNSQFESQWRVQLQFDLERKGHVTVELVIQQDEQLSGRFWAERRETAAEIRNRMTQFISHLDGNGFSVQEMHCHLGRPPGEKETISRQLIDLKT